MTTIKQCSCEHEFQDATYGKGRRLMNETEKKSSTKVYRCTVCKREH